MKIINIKLIQIFLVTFVFCLIGFLSGTKSAYAYPRGIISSGIGNANCSTSGAWCDGEGVRTVYRFTCQGYSNVSCPDGLKEFGLPTSSTGRLYAAQGKHSEKCNITVQLDVSDGNGLNGWILWYSGECEPTPTPTQKPDNTPTPTTIQPACNTQCQENKDCNNAKNGCTRCDPNTKTCQKPPTSEPTPTNTPPPDRPACNDSCSVPADCDGARNGCTYCDPGTKTCKTPPSNSTPTPTTRPPACNDSCNVPADCDGARNGCTYCDPGTKTCKTPPGNTPPPPPPPTATPTPDFDPNWCKCDGIEATDIIAGLPATFTAKGYVEAANSDKAYVKDFTFSFAKGNDVTTDRIAKSNPIPAISSPGEGGRINYKADWTYTMPQNLEVGATYSIWADIKCERKTTAYNYTAQQDRGVLGAETESLWGIITNFFARLFGRGAEPVEKTVAPENSSLPNASVQQEDDSRQINIGTFHPAEIIQKSCKIIKFKPVQ